MAHEYLIAHNKNTISQIVRRFSASAVISNKNIYPVWYWLFRSNPLRKFLNS